MKFVYKKQLNDYFYNNNMEYLENVDKSLHIRARDIFICLQQKNMLKSSILFLIGPGHNGKLALEIARLCAISHIRVHLFLAQSTPSKDEIISSFRNNVDFVQIYNDLNTSHFQALFTSDTQIIDGLFATGISSKLDEHYSSIIEYVNTHAHGDILSLILPSGMKNTNHVNTLFIQASYVITLDFALITLLTNHYPIRKIICIPSSQKKPKMKMDTHVFTNIPKTFKPSLNISSHKHNRGTIFSFGGTEYFGASILALKAMMKINACMVHHFGDSHGKYALLTAVPEIIFHDINSTLVNEIPASNIPSCAVLGFGARDASQLLSHYHFLSSFAHSFPIILDAGALDMLPSITNIDSEIPYHHPLILTPHIGEFARMNNTSIKNILRDKIRFAQNFAKDHNVILVLKGDQTLVTDGIQTWVNPAGNPILATPGSGDVLSGVIAAHLDHTITPDNLFSRVCQAVFRHSNAADILAKSNDNITASMLIEQL
ncbi:MAG: bifunctional ADP-dependent NAD(P)H-hydrate dehydratase/NAD(P)H-hydrate epimerase [Culicoidibacterales bacterium]